ncbi:biofilm development regulator YmgB/AriR family protein [uncultured Pluralibacter sp.]|uniref:biofilm development regulator YmgB/AriR family protein n=1 Tax=uncultured Pluralibacter sp. TaxID=1490864 RepID=UPI00261C22DC|nr:biofilm development regulator YmgB/AriR family protein [uncultured Pluralibacter sp.]
MMLSLNNAVKISEHATSTGFFASISDKNLASYFFNSGSRYEEEKLILGAAVRNILALNHTVTNKNLIVSLLTMLECSEDVVTSDIIRHTLEIVVQYTHDDM